MIVIERAHHATPELVAAFAQRLPLLSTSAQPPSLREFDDLVAQDQSSAHRIVGSLTLILFRIPTGLRAWIEDVVIDHTVRGKGIGEAVLRDAARMTNESGATSINLTSHPNRTAAHRLYGKSRRCRLRHQHLSLLRTDMIGMERDWKHHNRFAGIEVSRLATHPH